MDYSFKTSTPAWLIACYVVGAVAAIYVFYAYVVLPMMLKKYVRSVAAYTPSESNPVVTYGVESVGAQ